jgi:hypothetical protein
LQEQEEFEHLNLDTADIHFSERLRVSFNEEKDRIINSARRNQ